MPSILDAEVIPRNYNIFRCDRLENDHGGVFIATKKTLVATEMSSWNSSNYECVYVKIVINPKCFLHMIVPFEA